MSPGRWDAVDELAVLRESMERLFDETFTCRPPLDSDSPVLWEEAGEFVFRVEIPGAEPAQIEVTLSEDTLALQAGGVRRLVSLPAPVAPGQARARYRAGMLEVRMPKAGTTKDRRISVEAA